MSDRKEGSHFFVVKNLTLSSLKHQHLHLHLKINECLAQSHFDPAALREKQSLASANILFLGDCFVATLHLRTSSHCAMTLAFYMKSDIWDC